ncbi:MAG: hypothetical protein ACR2PQ_00395 [Myxococcota bacterium]
MTEPDPRDEPSRVDELLRPFLSDSMLWPLSLVGVVTISTFGAYLLVRVHEGDVFAIAALFLLGWMSFDGARGSMRRGRPGPVAILILVLWAVSAAGAVAGVRLGLF